MLIGADCKCHPETCNYGTTIVIILSSETLPCSDIVDWGLDNCDIISQSFWQVQLCTTVESAQYQEAEMSKYLFLTPAAALCVNILHY